MWLLLGLLYRVGIVGQRTYCVAFRLHNEREEEG